MSASWPWSRCGQWRLAALGPPRQSHRARQFAQCCTLSALSPAQWRDEVPEVAPEHFDLRPVFRDSGYRLRGRRALLRFNGVDGCETRLPLVARRAPHRPMGGDPRGGGSCGRHPVSASEADGWGTPKLMIVARRNARSLVIGVEGGRGPLATSVLRSAPNVSRHPAGHVRFCRVGRASLDVSMRRRRIPCGIGDRSSIGQRDGLSTKTPQPR